jgi:uncharacterized membrane protein
MEFTCTVDIDAPRERVVAIFQDPENLKYWQEGFISAEHLEGEKGRTGAISRLRYKMGKREMDLMETILKNDLPHEFVGLYVHEHMSNTMTNTFKELPNGHTRYTAHLHYTEFHGFMIKVMAFLFPGMFKRQVQKWLDRFKVFVEKQT